MPSTVPEAENIAINKTKIPEPMGYIPMGETLSRESNNMIQFQVTSSIMKKVKQI